MTSLIKDKISHMFHLQPQILNKRSRQIYLKAQHEFIRHSGVERNL